VCCAAYKCGCFLHETNLLFLQNLRSFIALNYNFIVWLLLRVHHQTTVQLDKLLKTVVALLDRCTQFLYLPVFVLYFFVKMRDFCWKIGNIVDELLKDSRCVFCDSHSRYVSVVKMNGLKLSEDDGVGSMKSDGCARKPPRESV
jgi:hypothetical protein